MAATTIVTEALQSGKAITREHGEYRAAFDGNTIGYFDTYRDAELALDTHVYDLLSRGLLGPAETTTDPEPTSEAERCASCSSAGTMVSPGNGRIYCVVCGQPWRFAPVAADPEELEGPQEEGGEGGPNTEADDFAAELAHAERMAAAHQLGSGPAVWWERPYLFDIDAAGARADHLVPMLLQWRAA